MVDPGGEGVRKGEDTVKEGLAGSWANTRGMANATVDPDVFAADEEKDDDGDDSDDEDDGDEDTGAEEAGKAEESGACGGLVRTAPLETRRAEESDRAPRDSATPDSDADCRSTAAFRSSSNSNSSAVDFR